jgi:heterodisulfide reductase subunit A-like polyferredoxin
MSDMEQIEKKGAVLVIGAGIAGIQSSLDLANSGFKVYLVEESAAIGGIMAQLDKTFPTNDCAMCIVSPKLVECGRHLNIELLTNSELMSLEGEAGNFRARIFKHPRFVDLDDCTGCGECAAVCPVNTISVFDEGLVQTTAVYKPYAQAFPNAFVIEKNETPPCQLGCPANIHVQGYVALAAKGKYKEAYDLIRMNNPFVSVCGRVCFHPCETQCYRGEYDEPIDIRSIKKFIADYVHSHHEEMEKAEIAKPEGEKVAIIGAGPAGLTCGFYLARMGYRVSIFEKDSQSGGMMRSCIPPYRLSREELDWEIGEILKEGIDLKLNYPIESASDIEKLKAEGFKVFYVGIGAQLSKMMGIEGENMKGVWGGVDFLKKVNYGEKVDVGKKVAVVGGGNTAIDCARTALRLGADEVNLICLETRNLESKDRMPAHSWEIEEAEEEGVIIRDRRGFKGIETENGRLCGVLTTYCESVFDKDGVFAPVVCDDIAMPIISADTLIIAIGQGSDLSGFDFLKSNRGTVSIDPETFATNIDGFFAGGDVATGPASVVSAIGQGHEAAISIDRYLRGEDLIAGRDNIDRTPSTKDKLYVPPESRVEIPELKPEDRICNFDEIELSLSEEEIRREANRCLSCGICSGCLQCEIACEANAIKHDMVGEMVDIEVGAVILANGADKYDPSHKYEYGYGMFPNVVTSIQFERILSASGPFAGHIERPSDSKKPRKIAWIQCVGSRDTVEHKHYCSSVCCMYAIKEAVIAKEHESEIEPTIFYMDLRAYGKDFEAYYNRAKETGGVRFVRSRVGKVLEIPETGNLMVYYSTEDNGRQFAEEFDMVVLSVGFEPSSSLAELENRLGIRLNRHSFVETSTFKPVSTSREGVFVCGPASAPKDIPETVTQASGAVAGAESILASARGTAIAEKVYPPERDISREQPRIGVFICHCGINIGSVVDVPSVVDYAKGLANVVYASENLFTCSQDTQEKMKSIIEEYKLNKVVVASCSPRTHEPLFQETLRESGLNPRLFEMANIRDQCSWVHRENHEAATEKSKYLLHMAVAKAALLEPLPSVTLDVNQSALVIGGGLAGMVSAISIAEQGFDVNLIEAENELGGNMRNIYFTPAKDDVQGYLQSLIETVEEHPRITVHKMTRVSNIEGYIGNYKTTITNGETEKKIEHGVIVVATGAEEYKPDEYLYGSNVNVITQNELEEKLFNADKGLKKAKNIVMIQCVGSRDEKHPYCSRICCTKAIKNAIELAEANPKANIYILYRDIRTYGFNEEYYEKARDAGVVFIRYNDSEKPVVSQVDGKIKVEVKDAILEADIAIEPDYLVLAPAIVPRAGAVDISRMLKAPLNEDGFFLEAHVKLRPVDFATEGVFLAGLAHAPKTMDETISQAMAAAARACTLISKDKYTAESIVANVNQDVCVGCGICEAVCPYSAPKIIIKDGKKVSEVNVALCKGCGNCACSCPSGAMEQLGFKYNQTATMLENALNL